jgi:TonB family protein
MKRKNFHLPVIFLIFLLLSVTPIHAQSPEILAKSAVMNAEEAYSNGQYSDCLSYLKDAETNLGKTNSRIQYLKVKALMAKGSEDRNNKTIWLNAKNELKIFFDVTPPDKGYNEEKYNEMVLAVSKIKKYYVEAGGDPSVYEAVTNQDNKSTAKTGTQNTATAGKAQTTSSKPSETKDNKSTIPENAKKDTKSTVPKPTTNTVSLAPVSNSIPAETKDNKSVTSGNTKNEIKNTPPQQAGQALRPAPVNNVKPEETKNNTSLLAENNSSNENIKSIEKEKTVDQDTNIYIIVEDPPVFMQDTTFGQWIAKHVVYPVEARESGIAGKVYCEFVVDENGNVIYTKIKRGVYPLLDKAAIDVIKSSPKWLKPGFQGGKKVRTSITMPITFSLSE